MFNWATKAFKSASYHVQNLAHEFNVRTNCTTSLETAFMDTIYQGVGGALHLRDRYPSKTFGVLALPAAGAIIAHSMGSEQVDIPLALSGAVKGGLAGLLIMRGDETLQDPNDVDPQDRQFSIRHVLMNPRAYPYEFCSIVGNSVGLASMAVSGAENSTGDKGGYLIMSGIHASAWAIESLVPEKAEATEVFENKWLNTPGIKQVANFVETKTLLVSGLLYEAGVLANGATELFRVGGSLPSMSSEIKFNTVMKSISNLFYMSASKRMREADNENNIDTERDETLNAVPPSAELV